MNRVPLPIDGLLAELVARLDRTRTGVVVAPPGSGKTTRVPPALLDAGLAGDGRVVVLQPRRVAARLAARRIAEERGGRVGEEVGYRVRFEDRTSATTRIEILTEGLLTRRLQGDPFLDGVAWVVLDEFHERSLHADLALALLHEVRWAGRPDLGLVVMSATLDPDPVVAYLGGPAACPVFRSDGRTWPVDIRYDPRPDDRPLVARCAGAIRSALAREPEGHVLAFLPGVGEILQVREALADVEADVLPLHGRLPGPEQDRALAPSDRRKVVLATNVAETSVTLEGVRVVVDTGLAREPRFDPGLGLERLETIRIARDAADQRAGRAGRTGPGVCVRLWTLAEHHGLAMATVPEVRRADLARTALELRAWGVDPATFAWFEAPPAGVLDRAGDLLLRMGAVDRSGAVTRLGRTLLAMPLDVRLARVVAAGAEAGCLEAAATVAALASERDPFWETPPEGTVDSDLHWRLETLSGLRAGGRRPPGTDARALDQLLRVRDDLVEAARRALPASPTRGERGHLPSEETLARVLLAGFPDRVAWRRPGPPGEDRYLRTGGRGAVLGRQSAVRGAELVLAVTLAAGHRESRSEDRIQAAVALERGWLDTTRTIRTWFDREREAVLHREEIRYLDLVLEDRPSPTPPDPAQVSACLAEAATSDVERAFHLEDRLITLLGRLRFLALHRPDLGLPAFWDLRALVPSWCANLRSYAQTRDLDLARDLLDRLSWRERRILDDEAPERLPLPSGIQVRLGWPGTARDHLDAPPDGAVGSDSPLRSPPVLAARIQQLFGLRDTPRVAGVPVLVHLLAPSGRPAQVTRDLAGFWAGSYAEVRKDLRGRYPKHAWPEDPATWVPRPPR